MEMKSSDEFRFLPNSNPSMVPVEACVARILDDALQNGYSGSEKMSRSTAIGGVNGNHINHLCFPALKGPHFTQGYYGGNSPGTGTFYIPREKGTGVFLPAATADYALAYKITISPKKPKKSKKDLEKSEQEKKDGVTEDVSSEYCLPQEWTY